MLTVKYFGTPYHIGERWFVWGFVGAGVLLDFGYGNAGTTTMQNINYYGGSLSWMGIVDNMTGIINMDHLYCGPPPHSSLQDDKAQTWNAATYNKAVTGIQVTDAPSVQILSGSTVVWQKP